MPRSPITRSAAETERRAAAVLDGLLKETPAVLALVAGRLERLRATQPLDRTMKAWDLSHAAVGRMFNLSRQAIAKWMSVGVPAERSPAIADLAAATDLLERYVKADRIPAVVRRPAPALGGRSLLQLAESGDTAGVLAACREMFAFGDAGA
jgi:hypothetical protein